jgi:molybdopterin-binding protein
MWSWTKSCLVAPIGARLRRRALARGAGSPMIGANWLRKRKPRQFTRTSNGQSRAKFYCNVKRRSRIRATLRTFGRATFMKISARNVLSGKVIALTKGATTAHVKIEIAAGAVVTASITNEAVDALGLAVGKKASAVIKASDVMVAVD